MQQAMPLKVLLRAIDVYVSDRLYGWEWFRHKMAIIGALTMSEMSNWAIWYTGQDIDNQAWYNIQIELQAIQHTLQRVNLPLPDVLQRDLDYYCNLPPQS
jgi:hypothetical protein